MVLSKHGKLPKELSMHVKDDDRKKLMHQENLQKLSDEVVVADVVPQRMTALASDNLLWDGKLGVMSSRIPQEQGDASSDEKPPTRRDFEN
ncbi:unnamed protein product [Sphagnum jensenii]|uniref:Uncharacterized protein n=1 Tax=Sphagnum jensenii TaxID=128206 RepID=A0ABP1BLS8_9BRYO